MTQRKFLPIPVSGLGGDSDNAYGYISGNDHYQELIVGRFSSETVAHVDTQVLRTIEYEHGDQLASGWLNKIMSVASNQGPGDDGELDYQHLRNIQPDLLAFTYESPVYEMFDGSQGGSDATGNPTVANVALALNTGVGITNYIGHGSDTGWVTSDFSVSNVNALTNHNKLPFIFDVACVNGNFKTMTCFAESWMRAQNANEPTGAIAINASTINQSWSPPMIAQDEMVDVLVGLSPTGVRRTYGSIIVNGYFKMNEESSDFSMTDTWTCFGDPSLLVRTDDPQSMTITHSDVLVIGASTFDVNCNFEGALATLSLNGQIIGSATVTGGVAQIPVQGVVPGQVLTLAIVGFNQITYIDEVTVISPSGSYLVVNSFDNSINYGETKNIDIALKNVGADVSNNAQTTVSTIYPNAILTNNNYNYGTINADAVSALSTGANTLTVSNNIPDQTPISINISLTDDSAQVWNENKNVIVNAPSFTIGSMMVNDATGNNDGILDPGETADLIITVTNTGHASVNNVIGNISSTSSDLTLNTIQTSPYVMDVNGIQTFMFNVTASSATPAGTNATVHFYVTGGIENQYNNQKDFNFVIGFVPSYCTVSTTNQQDEFISRVQFNTIDNSSTGVVAYSDYTSISTTVNAGQTYPITVTNGKHFSSDKISCWVDWNYDGDFSDANETYVLTYTSSTNGTGVGTGNIAVPSNAHIGNNRMRIRLIYTGTNSPCGNSSYGETEDYNVIVSSNLGYNELNEDEVQIFPNPNNGTFEIQWSSIDKGKANSLEIFNIRGQLIYKTNQLNQINTIALQPNTGIYLLKLTSNDKVLIKKMIIE